MLQFIVAALFISAAYSENAKFIMLSCIPLAFYFGLELGKIMGRKS